MREIAARLIEDANRISDDGYSSQSNFGNPSVKESIALGQSKRLTTENLSSLPFFSLSLSFSLFSVRGSCESSTVQDSCSVFFVPRDSLRGEKEQRTDILFKAVEIDDC